MPKMKSHSGAKKRFKKSGTGKWRHAKPGRRHLLAPNSSSYRMALKRKHELPKPESKVLDRYLPYA